jgi:hypothetical protein
MKKLTLTKLMVRRETIRTLASTELVHAVGGDPAALVDSGKEMCPNQVDSGKEMCPGQGVPKPLTAG